MIFFVSGYPMVKSSSKRIPRTLAQPETNDLGATTTTGNQNDGLGLGESPEERKDTCACKT